MAPLLLALGLILWVVLEESPIASAVITRNDTLFAEAIPAAAWIDDGERSLTCDHQEVSVSRDQQIGIAIDRRRKHPPVIRIANGKR